MEKHRLKAKFYKVCVTGICMLAAGICYSCGRKEPVQAGKQEPYMETVEAAEAGAYPGGAVVDGESGTELMEMAGGGTGSGKAGAGGAVEETVVPCYVHICGQVVNPGVYEIESGSRIFQAVEAAGGLTGEAADGFLNMAEIIQDGMKIFVPSVEEVENGQAAAMTGSGGFAGSGTSSSEKTPKVNLNTASKEQLMTLRGIGESRAEDIIRYREEHGLFRAIEEIMEISGIKDAAFQKIKDDITV